MVEVAVAGLIGKFMSSAIQMSILMLEGIDAPSERIGAHAEPRERLNSQSGHDVVT